MLRLQPCTNASSRLWYDDQSSLPARTPLRYSNAYIVFGESASRDAIALRFM